MRVALRAAAAAIFLCVFGFMATAGAAGPPGPLEPKPAAASPMATQAMMLGAAWAGGRAVAVGDQGVVLLSDDQGKTVRQARSVPVSSSLTGVSFADAKHGWSVGHWGVILATADGGETWKLQRLAASEDRPLFAVHFFDTNNGIAAGLWSLILTTEDGGKTWVERKLSPPPGAAKADANLLALFADGKGRVYAAAERGLVLRSEDRGLTWQYLSTGYKGSLWSGIALADGTLVVGGQRGTVYRSVDDGKTWAKVELDNTGSVTGFAAGGGELSLVGLDGLRAVSKDSGQHFMVSVRADRLSLTVTQRGEGGTWLNWSRRGLAPDAAR